MAFSFRNLFQEDAPETPARTIASHASELPVAPFGSASHVATSPLPFAGASPFSLAPAPGEPSPFQQGQVPDLLSLGLGPGPFSQRPPSAAPSSRADDRGHREDGAAPPPSSPAPAPPQGTSSPFAVCEDQAQGDSERVAAKPVAGPSSTAGLPGFPTSGDPDPAPTMQPDKAPSSPFSLAEGTAETSAPPSSGDQSRPIRLSLHSALKEVPAKDLGFEASRIPKEVEVEIPLSSIQSQLASGRVVVPISLIQAGCEERFRPAFVRASPDLLVELPIAEVFRALPQPQAQGTPASNPDLPRSPFATLSEFSRPAAPETQAGEGYEESVNEGLGGAQLLGSAPGQASRDAPPAPADQGSAPARGPEPAPPSHHTQPATGGFDPPPSFLQNAPRPAPQVSAPETPPAPSAARHDQGAEQPADSPPPPPAPRASTPQLPGLQFGYDEDPDQIVLRALFGSQVRFTPQSVVERCAALPGIVACATIRDGKVIHHADDQSAAAEEFRLASPGVLRRVIDLTNELGLEDLDTFTIRSKVGTVSFFLEDSLCLAILHAAQDLPPGARERLIVISRELAKISRQR